ncbi:hypothetical protein GCM10022407_42050 [Hymenobacter antarcticus]|uniref:Uncharacterized protein n=1 Tax=Hymenobacter antarcticus TaxID=486270 RepID=A0ABP7R729_9BACT
MLVDVEELDFVMPEGVVIVLDLLVVAEPLVMVLDLVMPAGLVIVLDFVVTLLAGTCAVRVVIFEELVLIVEVLVGGVGAGVWARAAELPSRLSETRKPMMRFINQEVKGEKWVCYAARRRRSAMYPFFQPFSPGHWGAQQVKPLAQYCLQPASIHLYRSTL